MLAAVLMMLITAARGNEIVTLHVTRVVDGDTFGGYVGNGSGSALNQITVRINGIIRSTRTIPAMLSWRLGRD